MIHKVGGDAEKRHENHWDYPGELELVAAFFIHYVNHETGRNYEGNSKVELEVFFEAENEKGQKENLNGDEQEVDYETAVNVSVKNLKTLFVFDNFIICFFIFFHISK